jgi:hypothetical protein
VDNQAPPSFEKDYAVVWCHSGPNTPPVLGYWREVMQHAYDQMNNEKCSIRGPAYKIVNTKAQRALQCESCTQQAAYAIYEGLHLYCADHVPAAALAATRKRGKDGKVCHSPVR